MAYTKKELMGMNKVVLRKIARDAKANMTEAAKLSHEELVDWILENQDGGGEPEEKPKGKGAPARGKPAAREPEEKDEPEEKPRGRRAAPEPEEKDDGGCEGVAELSAKVDTIGNVLDELVKSGTDNYNELQAELFVIKNGLLKLCERLEAEEILTEASQTKGRTMAEEFQKLEDSTRGS